ncbi:MAG TPA: SDR family NAD(P)-dependent oxidoreductase [Steroidobacteraceae bacterium]|jgi:NAD(P)-dependent dehydrogenase (short-subunit alcohol dehydrogenase family)
MKDFKGQLAFITGGASGAGFGQATLFGRAGVKIVIADVRGDAISKAVGELAKEGITAHGIALDITDREAYARAADEVERLFGGPPTLLFNTAGVNNFGPVERSTYGDFDWLIGVNLGGVVNGMMTFVPRMIKAKRPAHIVTTASLGGFMGSALAAPYSAAKAAVVNLMESYRMSLAKYDIGVSVLCPANIKSNIAESVRTRSEKYGPSGYVANEESIASLHGIYRHGMEPLELAGHVKRAIEENQLYVIPYPEAKELLRQRFDAIVAAVPAMETDPEGARKRVAALQEWVSGGARVFIPDEK